MSAIIQPSILAGFMELLPQDQCLFDQMKELIEQQFQLYGFWPLDTPAIEKDEVLLAKGGGETQKQIYHIGGDHSVAQSLRFDLTVPLARYCAEHINELSFPFRRYQIAKVYRGERSQRGRYREFYQCDIDIVGRGKLAIMNDAEIPSVIYQIFEKLGISEAVFHINHRRLLNGFFQLLGIQEREAVLRSMDKLAKIGREEVTRLLQEEGLNQEQLDQLFLFLQPERSNQASLKRLEGWPAQLGGSNEDYRQGLAELKAVYQGMIAFGIPDKNIQIDLSITRGLDYYTGMVYETFLEGYEEIGSVCSGGRYDNLAQNFSKEKLPGVGLSIGLTRLFYQLKIAGLLQAEKGSYLQVVVLPMAEEDIPYAVEVVNRLRQAGISSQIYLEAGKIKKKFSYTDRQGAAFALITGENERREKKVSLKNMATSDQETIALEEALEVIKKEGKADEDFTR